MRFRVELFVDGIDGCRIGTLEPLVMSAEPGRCPKCGMKLLATEAAPIAYACPMHPEVRSDQADRCSKCGMKLLPAQLLTSSTAAPDGHEHAHDHSGEGHAHRAGGIEWEDQWRQGRRRASLGAFIGSSANRAPSLAVERAAAFRALVRC
jgi:hypothetical protein